VVAVAPPKGRMDTSSRPHNASGPSENLIGSWIDVKAKYTDTGRTLLKGSTLPLYTMLYYYCDTTTPYCTQCAVCKDPQMSCY